MRQNPTFNFKQFDNLLKKKMSRKDFFIYLGLIVLGITGISSFMNNLSHINAPKKSGKSSVEIEFGAGPYGGRENKQT